MYTRTRVYKHRLARLYANRFVRLKPCARAYHTNIICAYNRVYNIRICVRTVAAWLVCGRVKYANKRNPPTRKLCALIASLATIIIIITYAHRVPASRNCASTRIYIHTHTYVQYMCTAYGQASPHYNVGSNVYTHIMYLEVFMAVCNFCSLFMRATLL